MATGELQALRHQIRDIAGTQIYNGLAGKPGLPFAEQRAQFQSAPDRIGKSVEEIEAEAEAALKVVARLQEKADKRRGKRAEVQAIVDQAVAIIDQREADQGGETDDDLEEDLDESDFEEFDEEEEEV